MRIAAIQMSVKIGKVEENVKNALSLVDEAIGKEAKLALLPEMFNTGYFCHVGNFDNSYFKLAEQVTGYTVKQFQYIAKKSKINIIVPFFEYYSPGVYYNSACLVNENGNIEGCYRKTHVTWSGTGWEKYYMKQGYEYPIFSTSVGKIGILICYDRDFPEAARTLGLKGADIICISNAGNISMKEIWRKILTVRAYENQVYVLGASLTGKNDEHFEFHGNSILVDPQGNIISNLDREEGVLIGDIDLEQICKARLKRFLYRDRRPELYSYITHLKNEINF